MKRVLSLGLVVLAVLGATAFGADPRVDLTVQFIEKFNNDGSSTNSGKWLIQGCPANDTMVLTTWKDGSAVKGISVTINGTNYGNFPTNTTADGKIVNGLAVRGWEGDDTIDLSEVTTAAMVVAIRPAFEIEITGDDGNDVIEGSDGKDIVYGGNGNDTISGRDADDILLGGLGDDLLKGGDGHDVVDGEEGDLDRLFGGCGNDKLGDRDGVRTARGGDGEDKITVTFRSGWRLNNKLASKGLIVGGADADFFEIHNNDPAAMDLALEGDVKDGYNDSGDLAHLYGVYLDTEAMQPNVETTTRF
jgi:Ca2+-binding RTX toxin-like protein